jgi:hypothetical protein
VTFDRLLAAYPVTQSPSGGAGQWPFAQDDLDEVFTFLGGLCLDMGLYRVHTPDSAVEWSGLIAEGFPSFRRRAMPFGYDWLGRQFAADRDRVGPNGHLCLLLEPGTGQALEIPLTAVELHQDGLIDLAEATLAVAFYRTWRTETGDVVPLGEAQCVGYRLPLFLNGSDEIGNLERTDMVVYWSFIGQTLAQVTDKTWGTPVTEVNKVRRPFFKD